MMDNVSGPCQATKYELRMQKMRRIKSKIGMFLFAAFWRILWFTGLGRPYSKLMCKLKLYRKFPDGRCMYCGIIKINKSGFYKIG